MNVVGVIPARWSSTRLPGKSLVRICGKPLIQWVIERARRATRLDALLVATDDARIAATVRELDVEAVMTRDDHPSGTDRVAEAVADRPAEIVINIQGDEPLVDPALLDRLAETLQQDPAWDMATAASPIRRDEELCDPSAVKAVWAADGRALYFSRAPIPCVRDGEGSLARGLHYRHVGLYGYRRAFLQRLVRTPPCRMELAEKLEQLRALHIGARMVVLETEEPGIGVDTPQDVAYVENVIRKLHIV